MRKGRERKPPRRQERQGGDDDTFGHDLNEMDGRECICGLPFPDEAGARQILYLLGVLGVLAVE